MFPFKTPERCPAHCWVNMWGHAAELNMLSNTAELNMLSGVLHTAELNMLSDTAELTMLSKVLVCSLVHYVERSPGMQLSSLC